MSKVTVLGLGAMGRALAAALVDAGHSTTVWNRTPGKADGLAGAREAESVSEAVSASELVIVCVVDYAASQQILDAAGESLTGRVLVNLTSDTPERARDAAQWASDRGIDYLDGAIMVPITAIGAPSSMLLYSGSQRAFTDYETTLKTLGGQAIYLGADAGTAALHDLAMLSFFYSTMAGLVHAFALVGADGVAAKSFKPFADGITAIMPEIVQEMAAHVDQGSYPGADASLRTEAAGIAHIIEASQARGVRTDVLDAVKRLADKAIDAGHGDDSFARVVEVISSKGKNG